MGRERGRENRDREGEKDGGREEREGERGRERERKEIGRGETERERWGWPKGDMYTLSNSLQAAHEYHISRSHCHSS